MIDLHVPFTPMQAPVAPAIKYGLHMLAYAYMRNLLISVVRAMTPSWMAMALEPSQQVESSPSPTSI